MKAQTHGTKVAMVSALAIAIVLTGVFIVGKNRAERNLDKEKIKSEKLLSEKIQLDEKLANMKTQLSTLNNKNAHLDKVVAERNQQLQKNEAEIKRLFSENASLSSLKKKVKELEELQDQINNEMNQMSLTCNALTEEKEKLNELLSASRIEINSLEVNNAILKALMTDNYRVEAVKGKNDKLTVNARRTDKLIVSFDMPANITSGLHFKIVDPKGDEFSSMSGNAVSLNTTSNNDYLLASAGNFPGQYGTSRSELVYIPEHKLEKGVYVIKIYYDNDYKGSTQIRLK